MTAAEPCLIDVVRVLSDTYTDAGVIVWLNARNRHLRTPSGTGTCSPAEYIRAGRIAEVYEVACRIEGSP